MRRKQIVHDHEMDFPPSGKFHTMEAVESGQQGVRVALDMCVIVL